MKHLNKDIGNHGENIAAQYLVNNKYTIIERNFRCKFGEIDIIAYNLDYLCFVEVKTRYETKFGFPLEAVNITKQHKIQRIAEFYIYEKNCYNLNFRFDVVEVLLNTINNECNVELIKNAFIT
ncbi:YraN family protein [Clostridium akagii]|uniref:YraN family protein n=1 Tax=Clostridium akagii TaxID=91623 RepID=UPI000478CA34|nr:YraN family protein [Clostridium akagii]